ncbi:concanavalin A-like lectin/glucanase domain-containing protein [Tricharina praecox]|uniref:concanavalin A-like lectin/glucanase domain-containing protein n=1 Tax=Tricharina praecox TaxID=43433 RepID=UPI00221F51C9|nr:concanavalin A-like lectin/glucanase domain-containing protein [Tricharina praecox]KAI5844843.1 concanavalin A-like lectin/glucanase domain-containing protein [Tricharina praecox]
MVQLLKAAFVGAAVLATAAYAQITMDCGANLGKCPESKPCCSQYGQCGIGAFCLGGCDPKFSNQLESCVAAPICQSKKHTFDGLTRVADKTKYLGDASRYDWVADGNPMNSDDGDLLLTMAAKTVGTVMASTRYVWYGNIKATMKTSRGAGVVSAFIMMSDMKDEIDFEWIGVDLDVTQTNYYFQGIPDYTHGGNISTSATFDEWHTYEVDWTEDSITWKVDGETGRTLKKSDTYNATSKQYDFPQTPSRVQLSLWPGGLATNDIGTINWAGGEIDWTNSADMKDPGYYYVQVKDVVVSCYDPPSGTTKKGSKSYYYSDAAGLQKNVVIGDKSTVLKSFLASGTDMDAAAPSSSAGLEGIETVPGLAGAGTGAGNRATPSGTTGTTEDTEDQGVAAATGKNVFSQGNTNDAAAPANALALRGSMVALLVALVGIVAL